MCDSFIQLKICYAPNLPPYTSHNIQWHMSVFHHIFNTLWGQILRFKKCKLNQQYVRHRLSKKSFSSVKESSLQEICASTAEGCLVKEAKKWATKAAKDYKIITHGERVRLSFHSKKAKIILMWSVMLGGCNSSSSVFSQLLPVYITMKYGKPWKQHVQYSHYHTSELGNLCSSGPFILSWKYLSVYYGDKLAPLLLMHLYCWCR